MVEQSCPQAWSNEVMKPNPTLNRSAESGAGFIQALVRRARLALR
jgi:hypothetical protein